jgi:hypothetical protein
VNNVLKPQANPVAKSSTQTPMEDLLEPQVPDTVQAPVHDQLQDPAQDGVHGSVQESSEEDWGFQDEVIVSSGNNTETNHGNGDAAGDGVGTPFSVPGESEDGCSKPIAKQLPEQDTQEIDSTASTELSEEVQATSESLLSLPSGTVLTGAFKVPPPTPVQIIQEPKIVQHGESVSATEPESHEIPTMSDAAKDEAVLYPCIGAPPCPPIDPVNTTDETTASTEDTQGQTVPFGNIAKATTEISSSSPALFSNNQVSENEQKAEANEVDAAGSKSESASERTASTAVETAEPEAESELRRRHGAKHEDSYTTLPCLPDPDDHEKQNRAVNWFWGLIDWIGGLIRGFFSWII